MLATIHGTVESCKIFSREIFYPKSKNEILTILLERLSSNAAALCGLRKAFMELGAVAPAVFAGICCKSSGDR